MSLSANWMDTLYELRSLFWFPLAFVTLWLVLLFAKKLLWMRLDKLFQRTHWEWDEELLKALERPVRFLVLFGSLSVSLPMAPSVVSGHWLTHVLSKSAIVLVLAWMGDRLLTVLLFHLEILKWLSPTLKNLLKVVIRLVVYSIAALIILEMFGVSITPLLASLGVGSLAVALALQDTLGNLFSGFYLVMDRPIRVDDVIRLEDGTEGKVQNIGWRSTRIELGSGNTVILPNSKLSSSRITNYELPTPEVTFQIPFQVCVVNDMERVERAVVEVARDCQAHATGAVKGFHPVVHFEAANEVGLKVVVSLRTERHGSLAKLRHEFLKALVDRFKRDGLDISSWNRIIPT